MTEPTPDTPITDVIRIEGNSLILRVGEYQLTVKIEGPEARPSDRFKLERGQTMFDLVLDAARTCVKEIGDNEFSAADLYHIAVERNPGLNIRRNSWNSHVVSSAPNHPSYRHYTSHRRYFRYLGKGKYFLDLGLTLSNSQDNNW